MAEAWEKRASENAGAFQAFAVYRDMLVERSLVKAAKVVGKDVRQLAGWSGKHDWVSRAHSYDVHLDRLRTAQTEKDIADMLVRHANEGVALQTMATRAMKDLEPTMLTSGDVARYIDLGVKLEREARGANKPKDAVKEAYLALWERLGGATGTEGA